MSFSCLIRRTLQLQKSNGYSAVASSIRALNILPSLKEPASARFFSHTSPLKSAEAVKADGEAQKDKTSEEEPLNNGRTVQKIPVETAIKYLQSKAYSITYGTDPVWKKYRRNFKGGIPPKKTRKTCIRSGRIATGNPCPICRDDYLVVSPENVGLLKQFISEHTGETINYQITGVCQKKQKELLSAIDIAKDSGALTFDVPFREYDYSEYRK